MVKAVVGANWGDEGKGKITDMLADSADVVIRFQGGANAGHTIVNQYGKFALHTLPSGVFHQDVMNIIGNGVALNVPLLFKEVQEITQKGVPAPQLMISDRCQIVMPYHIPSRASRLSIPTSMQRSDSRSMSCFRTRRSLRRRSRMSVSKKTSFW